MVRKLPNDRVLLIIILWFAFIFRIMSLSTTPGLSGDESFNGADAVEVLDGTLPVFFTNNYGREPLFIYSIATSMTLFGESIFAIRLTSVFYGMVSLVMTYVLTKRLWNRKVALICVGLISVSFWPVFISRIGLRAVTLPVFQSITLYSLYRGLKTQHRLWIYISGVGLGLCAYTYIPGRIFPLIPLIWICTTLFSKSYELRRNIKHLKQSIFISFLIAFIVFIPLGIYLYNHPEMANQRIKNLDWTLDQIKLGNIRPLLNNAILLFKMFFIQGDSDVYYNIPFRPIFSLSLGILFLIGVFICTIRFYIPEYQLMILWLVFMLLPSLMSTGGAIMRSVGALTPIYILPAVTINTVWHWWPTKSFKVKNAVFYGLLTIIIGSVGLKTRHDYFKVWTQLPRVRQIYGAGLSQIGQAMSSILIQPERQIVMVGCEYAADICRHMVKFQTQYDGPIHWFKSGDALVIPNIDDPSKEVYYFITDNLPLPEVMNKILNRAQLIQRFISPDGIVEGEVYQMQPSMTSFISPKHLMSGRFRDMMQLVGYDIPEQAYRGSEVEYVLYWKVPETFDKNNMEPPRWQALLTDGEGNYWSEIGGILPYNIWDWSPGEYIIQIIRQPVPLEVPQGYWYPEFSIYRQFGGTLVYIDENGNPSRYLTLNPVRILGNPTESIDRASASFGENLEIALNAISTVDQINAGSTLLTTVDWQVLDNIEVEYRIHFGLHRTNCESTAMLSYRQALVPEYPTTMWDIGEPIRAFYQFRTDPSIENGDYFVNIDLVWGGDGQNEYAQQLLCHPVLISGRPHTFDIPVIDVVANTPFSQGISLLGYVVADQENRVKQGETLEITLYWQPNITPLEDYVVFVHIYSDFAKSEIIGQHDSLPCNGQCPTSSWISGEILTDQHQIPIPDDAPPGEFPIGIGLYHTSTFERIEIPGHPDNVLILTQITVD